MSDHNDYKRLSQTYQDVRQSSSISMEDGQKFSYLSMAEGGQNSRSACDQTVVDSWPQRQSSQGGHSLQQDQSVTIKSSLGWDKDPR